MAWSLAHVKRIKGEPCECHLCRAKREQEDSDG